MSRQTWAAHFVCATMVIFHSHHKLWAIVFAIVSLSALTLYGMSSLLPTSSKSLDGRMIGTPTYSVTQVPTSLPMISYEDFQATVIALMPTIPIPSPDMELPNGKREVEQ